MASINKSTTTLVVGATGDTGKHVVQFLLNQQQHVKVICRSKEKLLSLLDSSTSIENLTVTEASILELSEPELKKIVADCDAVTSCLGHNMTMAGMWGNKDRRLVRDAVAKLTKVMPQTSKFILMGSDGVGAPGDDKRGLVERTILFLLRHLMNPHADNEEAASHLGSLRSPEWCVVRPTDLQNGPAEKYTIYEKPPGGLFASGITTRATVAKFMVELILDKETWSTYKYCFPVIHDTEKESTKMK